MTPPTIAMGSTVRQERMYLLDSRRGDWPEFSESLEPVLAPDGSLADRDDSLCRIPEARATSASGQLW